MAGSGPIFTVTESQQSNDDAMYVQAAEQMERANRHDEAETPVHMEIGTPPLPKRSRSDAGASDDGASDASFMAEANRRYRQLMSHRGPGSECSDPTQLPSRPSSAASRGAASYDNGEETASNATRLAPGS
eukprot:9551190-Karenia_brevis.AAC.1